MKKKIEKKTYSVRLVGGLVAVCLIATLAIGSIVVASQGSLQDKIAEVAGTILGNSLTKQLAIEEESLGGVTMEDETFTGDVTVNGDLTVDGYMSDTIDLELNFDQATSSAVGSTVIVLGKQQYTGSRSLVCSLGGEGVVADIQGVVPWKYDLNVGTTTCAVTGTTCGDGTTSFTTTSTKGLLTESLATSTAQGHILNSDDDEGDYALEQFVVNQYDWFIATMNWTGYEFSTSTLGTTAGTGNTAVAYDNYVKIKCKYRDEAK